jgi:hypothetical protein
MQAYKLLRVRKDGSIGPLFINRKQRIPIGKWLKAEAHRTKGYAFRPGWHCTAEPIAPHLSKKGRAWFVVEIKDYEDIHRPSQQGGLWYLAKNIFVKGPINWRNGNALS